MINAVLPTLFEKCYSIDLNSRHGAVLSIGEILFALSEIAEEKQTKIKNILDSEIVDSSKKLIPNFRERLYFRGMGGELMRQACSDFIEKCSLAHMPFHGCYVIGEVIKIKKERK